MCERGHVCVMASMHVEVRGLCGVGYLIFVGFRIKLRPQPCAASHLLTGSSCQVPELLMYEASVGGRNKRASLISNYCLGFSAKKLILSKTLAEQGLAGEGTWAAWRVRNCTGISYPSIHSAFLAQENLGACPGG